MVIRLATKDDVFNIMKFIKKYWNENHILANDREFFEWMYVDGSHCSFVIAIEGDMVYGIYGFIIYNHEVTPDMGSSLWKTIKCDYPFLGVTIQKKCEELMHERIHIGIGLNRRAVKLYNILGAPTGQLTQYYRLRNQDEYKVACISQKEILPFEMSDIRLKKLTREEFCRDIPETILKKNRPYKSKRYLLHRYFEHPIYQYQCYGIEEDCNQMETFIFCREVECMHTKILKMIDVVGDTRCLAQIGKGVEQLIERNQYEYVDFYCYGIGSDIMKRAGFSVRKDDVNIIPQYFEPFEQKNVDINIIIPEDKICIFRGDGDMDRPSKR